MVLYHYFDKKIGPFRNLSDLSEEEANQILLSIKETKPNSMCAKRQESYISDRRRFEGILREEFLKKGGKIERNVPHYLVVGKCPWLQSWYEEILKIIDKYGLPQDWNPDGKYGPERYVEVHVWSDIQTVNRS